MIVVAEQGTVRRDASWHREAKPEHAVIVPRYDMILPQSIAAAQRRPILMHS
jgi:hypothetical protein